MKQPLVISYSRADSDSMLRVREYLQSRGIRVWSDETLQPGTPSWTRAIETAIDSSLGLLVILSPNAKASEWVAKEIGYANTQQKFIFPVLALGEPSRAVPFQLSNVEFTDIRTDFEAGMARLLDAVKERLRVLAVRSKAEVLRFAAQAPHGIERGTWAPVFAYVYHASATDSVSEDMAQIADAGWQPTGPPKRRGRFPDPELISVVISGMADGLLFNPYSIAVNVHDVWQRFEFGVRVGEQYSSLKVRAPIAFAWGGPIEVPFAEVVLELSLKGDDSEPTDRAIAKAAAYQTIFACYSQTDASFVEAVAAAYSALGTEILRNAIELNVG